MPISLEEVERKIASDHHQQVDAEYYVRQASLDTGNFLDLGAGDGRSFDIVQRHLPEARWIGLDIPDSAEVRSRRRTDCVFQSYDGVNIPFEDDFFDVIYSRQVFEHVRHPDLLLKDIARVLKPGGFFIGSVSQLEPLHSLSYWNFTYFGFATLAKEAGLDLCELRPGIDALSLISRHFLLFGLGVSLGHVFLPWFANESPLNGFIKKLFANRHLNAATLNKLQLTYSGHFCFKFTKLSKPE